MSRLLIRPCANCARPIKGGSKVFCCELCSDVPNTIRYIRRTIEDGRIEDPLVQDAIDIKLALILAGGYPKSARRLSAHQRSDVVSTAQGRCAKCGAPGDEVDHIKGSSSDSTNLQLLCHECHLEKTHDAMSPAPEVLIEGVSRPILRRARNEIPNQPCDSSDWDHRRWAGKDPKFPKVANAWAHEFSDDLEVAFTEPLIFVAADGFPRHLDPWTWY